MKKLTKKEQEAYDDLIDIVNVYIKEDYPDLRKMPKEAKERYASIKRFYRDIAIIRVSNGPIGDYFE